MTITDYDHGGCALEAHSASEELIKNMEMEVCMCRGIEG